MINGKTVDQWNKDWKSEELKPCPFCGGEAEEPVKIIR